ncbi:hypothetical protein [Cytobacillus firmus]|uniref:hypothetical protein n=1 Tax=Cytobacillus firmus TaxID=1399 RepID=UPI001DDC2440|nr:hypothetical protein [Cytobacillus firmus]MBG9588059.1 hypothetical protein [Cytobacillus firmus]
MERIEEMRVKRSASWARERVAKLMASAKRNPFQQGVYQSQLYSLDMYISMLLQYQEHLSNLERQIEVLAEEIEEYKIIANYWIQFHLSLDLLTSNPYTSCSFIASLVIRDHIVPTSLKHLSTSRG